MKEEIICPICLSEINGLTRLDCDHDFCTDCITEYIQGKINDGDSNIYCPYESCNETIDQEFITNIIDDSNDSDHWREKYQQAQNISDLSDDIIYSMCPNCKTICKKDDDNNKLYCCCCCCDFCYICHENHDSYWEYDNCPNQSEIDEKINEIMDALGESDVKPCPICRAIIFREEGCSSIRCKYCKVKFCWSCLKTNQAINNSSSHNCENFDGFIQTNSDDDYVDGYD